tara:strand:+ start:1325 stop:1450 length:126 start_codon:yes stop_codon:yes gene_type:complete
MKDKKFEVVSIDNYGDEFFTTISISLLVVNVIIFIILEARE